MNSEIWIAFFGMMAAVAAPIGTVIGLLIRAYYKNKERKEEAHRKEVEAQAAQAQQQAAENKEETNRLGALIRDLTESFEKTNNARDMQIHQMGDQLHEAQQRNAMLEKTLFETQADHLRKIGELQQERNDLNRELTEARLDIKRLEGQFEDLMRKHAEERAAWGVERAKAQAEHDRLQKEFDALCKRYETLEKDFEALRDEKRGLQIVDDLES